MSIEIKYIKRLRTDRPVKEIRCAAIFKDDYCGSIAMSGVGKNDEIAFEDLMDNLRHMLKEANKTASYIDLTAGKLKNE